MIKIGDMSLNAKTLPAYKKKVSYVDFSSMKFSQTTVYDEIYSQTNFTKWSTEKKEKQLQKSLYELDLLSGKLSNFARCKMSQCSNPIKYI